MNKHIYLVLLFLSYSLLATEKEVEILGIKKAEVSTSMSKEEIESIVTGGSATQECKLKDYDGVYTKKAGINAAKRDYVEGISKYYGVADGIGPIFPGKTCSKASSEQRVIIWPTVGCKKNLSQEEAIQFAKAYNNTIYNLKCTK